MTRCYQCRKYLCKACVVVSPHGSFCSSECGVIYREFQGNFIVGERKRPGILALIVLLLMFVFACMITVHVFVRYARVEVLQSIDFIGKIRGMDIIDKEIDHNNE